MYAISQIAKQPQITWHVSNCVQTYYKSAYFANYAEENCENSITDMLIGQESVAHQLNYIKDFIRNDEKYSYLSNNALLNYLYTVQGKNIILLRIMLEYQHPSSLYLYQTLLMVIDLIQKW